LQPGAPNAGRPRVGEFVPSDSSLLLRHIRLDAAARGEAAFAKALGAAADQLVAELGLGAAIGRLAALPVPLPTALLEAVARLPWLERRALLQTLLREPASPVGRHHLARLLRAGGTLAEERLAGWIVKSHLTAGGGRVVAAFLDVLWWVEMELDLRPDVRTWSASARLAAAWCAAHWIFGVLSSIPGALDLIHATFAEGRERFAPTLFGDDPDYRNDVAHPRNVDLLPLLVSLASYGAGDRIVDFADGLVRRRTEEIAPPSEPDGRLLIYALQRDPLLGSNSLGAFLAAPRDDALNALYGAENAATVAPEALRARMADAVARLTTNANDVGAWADLAAYTGSLPSPAEHAADLEAALGRIDARALLDDPRPGGLAALAVAANRSLFVADPEVRRRVGDQLIQAARAVDERERRGSALTDLGVESWDAAASTLLWSVVVWAGGGEGGAPDGAERFANVVGRIVDGSPMAARAADFVRVLYEELPIDAAMQLAKLLTRVRAS
jgi:hypothetical protein